MRHSCPNIADQEMLLKCLYNGARVGMKTCWVDHARKLITIIETEEPNHRTFH